MLKRLGSKVSQVRELGLKHIVDKKLQQSMYIVDLSQLEKNIKLWKSELPMIKPFYAVKCNPDKQVIKIMIENGIGFDCASKKEIEMITDMGSKNIVFAHPCKHPRDIKFAYERQVQLTTLDSLSEIDKLAPYKDLFKCLIRIKVNNPDARIQLGDKYGADIEEVPMILQEAKKRGLIVEGVSFHVGSASHGVHAYFKAIIDSQKVFDIGADLGFDMKLLDIGGGFTHTTFDITAEAIRNGIECTFGQKAKTMTIIAEPGRYMVENVFTFFSPIIGKKIRLSTSTNEYYIADGLYGSFNCILYDKQTPAVVPLNIKNTPDEGTEQLLVSKVWGSTCDSADCVFDRIDLPDLGVGDWLMFPNFGAYTIAGSCNFNGIEFTKPIMVYVYNLKNAPKAPLMMSW